MADERKIAYLSSKYGKSPTGIVECARASSSQTGRSVDQIIDIVYEIESTPEEVCSVSEIGRRNQNEDTLVWCENRYTKTLGNVTMAGVFDGHGGTDVSRILETEICPFLANYLDFNLEFGSDPKTVAETIEQAIVDYDESLRDKVTAGSTLTMALITDSYIYTINLGDSRTVIFTPGGNLLFETKDHKPSDPEERKRIVSAGGRVINIWDVYRTNGNLSLSRAIGDFSEIDKPAGQQYSISNRPDVKYMERKEPVYILLACDGIWDVLSSLEAIEQITLKHNAKDLEAACRHLAQTAMSRGSGDNITVLLARA